MCGISKFKIFGNHNDWESIIKELDKLKQLDDSVLNSWIENVKFVIKNISECDIHFLNNFFYVEKCGSGSQEEVKGWITNLFINKPDFKLICNFSTHISKIEYKNLSSDEEYIMECGLFASKIENDYLCPEYFYNIYDKMLKNVMMNK